VELSNSNGGGCPTIGSVMPGESPISGTIEPYGLRLTDVGDDVWTLQLASNGRLQGEISSNDLYCMGIYSDNVVLEKID
jgi:hypothetical protein